MKPKKYELLSKYLSDYTVKFLSLTTKGKTTVQKKRLFLFHINLNICQL